MLGRIVLALALASALAGQALAQQPVVMRISHPVPTGHHVHKLIESFAADVKSSTAGAVEVQIFPA